MSRHVCPIERLPMRACVEAWFRLTNRTSPQWDEKQWRESLRAELSKLDDAGLERLFVRIGYAIEFFPTTPKADDMSRKKKTDAAPALPPLPPIPALPPLPMMHAQIPPPPTTNIPPLPSFMPALPGAMPSLPPLPAIPAPPSTQQVPTPSTRAPRGQAKQFLDIAARYVAKRPGVPLADLKTEVVNAAISAGMNKSTALVYGGKWVAGKM